MLQKWPNNVSNVEDNAYETLVFAYNKELDVLVPANSITKSNVKEESSPPYYLAKVISQNFHLITSIIIKDLK